MYQGLMEVERRVAWGNSAAAARAIGARPRVEGAPAEGAPLVERVEGGPPEEGAPAAEEVDGWPIRPVVPDCCRSGKRNLKEAERAGRAGGTGGMFASGIVKFRPISIQ